MRVIAVIARDEPPTGETVEAGGAMRLPVPSFRSQDTPNDGSLLRAGALWIDRVLRRYQGVHEFSRHEDDLLRIAVGVARHRVVLTDGTEVLPGDVVVDLHLWNERITALGSAYAFGLGWGSRAKRRMVRSLTALATYVETTQALDQCKAFRAEAVFIGRRRVQTLSRIAQRLGFGVPVGFQEADLGHTLLALGLTWVFQPGERARRSLRATRTTLWMSRHTLRARYFPRDGEALATCNGHASAPQPGLVIAEQPRQRNRPAGA